MAQIIQPQTQRQSGLGQLLQVGGAIAGGVTGGVMGAAGGAGAGSAIGNFVDPAKGPSSIPQAQGATESDAMARRQQQMSQDNLAVLKQAEAQLPQLPENLRQQYAPAIVKARILEEQSRGGS